MKVEFRDVAGDLLLAYPLSLRTSCSESEGGAVPDLSRSIRARVPYPEGVETIRFVHDGAVVHQLKVSRAAPEIEIQSGPPLSGTGKFDLAWHASHPDSQPLQFFCRYSNDGGRTWFRLGWRTTELSTSIDLDSLPGGDECQLAVVATDGVNTTIAKTAPFHVPLKPFIALIHRPTAGTIMHEGDRAVLLGQGYVLEERRAFFEGLRWSSSIDGELGQGQLIETRPLSVGEHEITLTVGEGERSGTASLPLSCKPRNSPD